ncbi:MAG: esterase [Lachnospiraceae bacterium]|nr:esterase [Lachnospiraceae bacterium]
MVDENDLSVMENEVKKIKELAGDDFSLITIKVDDWNGDLSPWEAPAAFGKIPFAGRANKTLEKVLDIIKNDVLNGKKLYIGGYSLAALFALWSAYETDIFTGVAAASPSLWFPNFYEHISQKKILTDNVYLSLGNKEEKTKNPVMSQVGDKMKATYELLKKQINCTLEWNEGNHFKDSDIRTAKAFAWVLTQSEK